MRHIFSFLVVMGLGLAGAGGLKAEEADQPVAKVNGEEIFFSDLMLAEEEMGDVMGQLPEDVRFQYLLTVLIDRQILSQKAREAGLENDPAVERRKAYYEQEIMAREPEDEVRARHILVATEKEAQDVISEVKGGMSFEEAAAEHSTGPSGENGGDLGYFVKGDMVAPFAEAAFALKPGEISDPVKTEFGWHVIKVEDRRPRPRPSFEEIEEQLTAEFAQAEGRKLIEELRNNASIEIVGADGKSSRPTLAPE